MCQLGDTAIARIQSWERDAPVRLVDSARDSKSGLHFDNPYSYACSRTVQSMGAHPAELPAPLTDRQSNRSLPSAQRACQVGRPLTPPQIRPCHHQPPARRTRVRLPLPTNELLQARTASPARSVFYSYKILVLYSTLTTPKTSRLSISTAVAPLTGYVVSLRCGCPGVSSTADFQLPSTCKVTVSAGKSV